MKKILMISTCNFLMNRNDGGKQCSYRNYCVLCQVFGVDNVYIYMISNDETIKMSQVFAFPAYTNKIQQIYWALGLRVGFSRKTEHQIVQKINQENFDYIWFDRSILGNFCKKIRTGAEKIIFFHNVEKKYIKNKISHENWGYIVSYPAFLINEWNAVKKADKIVCLNARDAELINEIYNRKADFLLPISFNDVFREKGIFFESIASKITGKLLFVGSLFRPNIDGIKWFIEKVMPQLPDINLMIVGKGLEKKAVAWGRQNVQVIGTVEDVSEYYAGADAIVLPIFYGDGMKVKTAEALMYGKAVFGTKEALEGYEIEEQPDIFECNTEKEFINSIKNFYKTKRETNISFSNRKLFLDKYDSKAIIKKVKDIFQLKDN